MKISDAHSENIVPLREQEFARPQVVAGILSITRRNIKSKIPEIQRSMQLYLTNRETEFILFRPIKVIESVQSTSFVGNIGPLSIYTTLLSLRICF